MASRSSRFVLLCAATLLIASLPAIAPLAAADHGAPHDDCKRGSASWAGIAGVSAGGVTLQSQLGSTTLELPRGLLNLAVSTTGALDVTVDHKCVEVYTLKWTKTDTLGQVTTGSVTMNPACVSGSDVHAVPVGNDVVQIQLSLAWTGCDGTSGTDSRDIKVVDPALTI